jgi:hypothetical protein
LLFRLWIAQIDGQGDESWPGVLSGIFGPNKAQHAKCISRISISCLFNSFIFALAQVFQTFFSWKDLEEPLNLTSVRSPNRQTVSGTISSGAIETLSTQSIKTVSTQSMEVLLAQSLQTLSAGAIEIASTQSIEDLWSGANGSVSVIATEILSTDTARTFSSATISLSPGALVGIIVGVIIAVTVVVAVLLRFITKKKSAERTSPEITTWDDPPDQPH